MRQIRFLLPFLLICLLYSQKPLVAQDPGQEFRVHDLVALLKPLYNKDAAAFQSMATADFRLSLEGQDYRQSEVSLPLLTSAHWKVVHPSFPMYAGKSGTLVLTIQEDADPPSHEIMPREWQVTVAKSLSTWQWKRIVRMPDGVQATGASLPTGLLTAYSHYREALLKNDKAAFAALTTSDFSIQYGAEHQIGQKALDTAMSIPTEIGGGGTNSLTILQSFLKPDRAMTRIREVWKFPAEKLPQGLENVSVSYAFQHEWVHTASGWKLKSIKRI